MSAPGSRHLELTPCEWFTSQMAADLGLGERPVDQRCRRTLLRLTLWATAEGIPLDREAILDPVTVEGFCATALAHDRSQGTSRSDLRRMARLLTTSAPWEIAPSPMSWRSVALPYSSDEIELLKQDALDQPTASRCRAARAFLALGLGAGLDGRWLTRVEPADVTCRDGFVEVTVGEPAARVVVVLAEWEDEILELASSAGEGCVIGRRSNARNRVADLSKSFVCPAGHPRLSPGRLRATWLLGHLEAGTRLPELCAAAGLKGFVVLSDLLDFVKPLKRAEARLMMRGSK